MSDKAMNEAERGRLPLPRKTLLWIAAGAALLLAAAISLVVFLNPMPPHSLTLATGPEGSSYATFGKRYKDMMAKQGVRVHLRVTTGGVENMALLRDPKSGVDLGFVDGGLTPDDDFTGVVSLGTLGYEPIWVFSRQPLTDRGLSSLKGKRVAVGPEGCDERVLLAMLGKRKALDSSGFILLTQSAEESVDDLVRGRIDAAIVVNSFASPAVRKLANEPGLYTADFARADAYVARFSTLTKRVLPEGAVDLEHDRPSHPVTLLATKTSLIAKARLHPALKYLVLEMLAKVHGRPNIFQKAAEFPAAEEQETELAPEARHFYKSGQPVLQRYMPFWLAVLVEQVAMLLIPLVGLAYPTIKMLMWLYGWGMQRKIFLIYGELHWIEIQLGKLDGKPVSEHLLGRMAALEARTARVRVPAKFLPLLYSLKDDLGKVRARIDALA